MRGTISHDWEEETLLAKARWFQSLTVEQRMDLFCEFTDLVLENNPSIVDAKDAQPTRDSVRVLELPSG